MHQSPAIAIESWDLLAKVGPAVILLALGVLQNIAGPRVLFLSRSEMARVAARDLRGFFVALSQGPARRAAPVDLAASPRAACVFADPLGSPSMDSSRGVPMWARACGCVQPTMP